ncbi:DoxX family protein [uncultured Draconibacterium sp.]|uniref:HvfX family Cu-binding RiPP maturation protein n=1 Tax=uncultured Draconibacterium sp. TaxID=1573823 RepID=UPI0029C81C5B|nr:DoxX family protein [uncultured Draconibacterium sp.]
MKTTVEKLREILKKLDNVILLLIRLILAYGFYSPAKMKLKDINSIASWFESMNYPLPTLSAYLATITETAGVILLLIGLGTRLISIPLIFVMMVAIFTVHFSNGFNAGDNGFEIPLYYIAMLLTLLVFGSGKFSVDNYIKRTH